MKELRKYLKTEIIEALNVAIKNNNLILIKGRKQATGKTTVCNMLREKGVKCVELENYVENSEIRREVFELDFDKFSTRN